MVDFFPDQDNNPNTVHVYPIPGNILDEGGLYFKYENGNSQLNAYYSLPDEYGIRREYSLNVANKDAYGNWNWQYEGLQIDFGGEPRIINFRNTASHWLQTYDRLDDISTQMWQGVQFHQLAIEPNVYALLYQASISQYNNHTPSIILDRVIRELGQSPEITIDLGGSYFDQAWNNITQDQRDALTRDGVYTRTCYWLVGCNTEYHIPVGAPYLRDNPEFTSLDQSIVSAPEGAMDAFAGLDVATVPLPEMAALPIQLEAAEGIAPPALVEYVVEPELDQAKVLAV